MTHETNDPPDMMQAFYEVERPQLRGVMYKCRLCGVYTISLASMNDHFANDHKAPTTGQ